jgi:transcriptional regulator with XRE-family HTH domain
MKLSRTSLGIAVKTARELQKMTLKDLAVAADLKEYSLSRSENGLRDLEFAEVVAIAQVLHVELAWIINLAENLDRSGVLEATAHKSEIKRELFALERELIEAAIEASAS